MGRLVIGFAVGVLVTALVLIRLDLTTIAPAGQTDSMELIAPSTAGPGRADSFPDQTPPDSGSPRAGVATAASSDGSRLPEELTRIAMRDALYNGEAVDLLRGWSDEELLALQERSRLNAEPSQEMKEAVRVNMLLSSELRRREKIDTWARERPPELPIQLPPEMSQHLQIPSVIDLHERLQRQPVDPEWSIAMEANLRSYFASAELLGTYGTPTINCRTTACEVAFVAYGLEAKAQAAQRNAANGSTLSLILESEFRDATSDFREQPWASQFIPTAPTGSFRSQNGTTTILWHLYRNGG